MTWAQKRIREYGEGQPATFIERQMLSLANPAALLLAIIGLVMLFYGLWLHAWLWIGAGIIVYLSGYGYGLLRGWSDRTIELYRHGEKATWLDQRILEHAHPVHFVLASIGLVMLVYGFWMHDWFWIIAGIILNVAGHCYTWLVK